MEKKKIAKAIFLVFILFGGFFPITFSDTVKAATIWYVSGDGSPGAVGNDGNSGTITSPFHTISRAINASSDGDTIYLRCGEYNHIYSSTVGIRITKSGLNALQPFLIATYPSDVATYGKATIDGTGYTFTAAYGLFGIGTLTAHEHYVTIQNIRFENASQAIGVYSTTTTGSCNYIKILDCDFYNINDHAIWFYAEGTSTNKWFNYTTIDGCTFDEIQDPEHMTECITLSYLRHFNFTNNTMTNFYKIGIDPSNGACYGQIAWNTFVPTYEWGTAIKLDSASYNGKVVHHVRIHNNTFWGTGESGMDNNAISLQAEVSGGRIHNITIENNVINRTGLHASGNHPFGINIQGSYRIENIIVRHNTINIVGGADGGFGSCLYIHCSNLYNIDIANNIFNYGGATRYCVEVETYETDDTNVNGESGTVIQFFNNCYNRYDGALQTILFPDESNVEEATAIIDDPEFSDRLDGNFNLNSSSPCIDAAAEAYSIIYDYNGVSRPRGSGYDIGAFEYSELSWYVSTTGDDDNVGDLLHPFATLWKACNVSANGDTIIMRGGSYTSGTQEIDLGDATGSWLTITNYTSEKVIINGEDVVRSSYVKGMFEITNCNYLRITGITFNHSAYMGIVLYEENDYIRIDNCSITNCSGSAFKVVTQTGDLVNTYITLDYNYIYNNQNNWSGVQQSQEGLSFSRSYFIDIHHNTIINNCGLNIDLKSGCNNATVHDNYFNTSGHWVDIGGVEYSGGTGIYVDGYTGDVSDVEIYNNFLIGNCTLIKINAEISTGTIHRVNVSNNFLYSYGSNSYTNAGYSISLGSHAYVSHLYDVYIYSNTVLCRADYAYAPLGARQTKEYYHDCKIQNNIFSILKNTLNYAYTMVVDHWNNTDDLSDICQINYNNYYRYPGTYTIVRISWANADTTTGGGSHSITTNPAFVDRFNLNLHINSTSPCCNVANSSLSPSFDYDDDARPYGIGDDIGADEYTLIEDFPPPTNITFFINETTGQLHISWDKGEADQVVLRRNASGYPYYPSNVTNGSVVYVGVAETTIDTGVHYGYTYNYSIWGWKAGNFSLNYTTAWITHLPNYPQNISYFFIGSTGINISWVKGLGADTTLIVRKNGSFSTAYNDGFLLYNGTEISNESIPSYANAYYTLFSFNSTNSTYSVAAHLEFGLFGINCFNESNPSQNLTFDVFVTNINGSQTYVGYDCTNTKYINFSEIPTGNKTIVQVSSTGYKVRYYYIDLLPGTLTLLDTYLPPSKIGSDDIDCSLRQFIDSETITNPAVDKIIDLSYTMETIIDVQIYNKTLYGTYGGWYFVPSDKYTVNPTNVTIDDSILDVNTTIGKVTYWYEDCETTDSDTALFLITVVDYYDQPIADVKINFKTYINTTDGFENISILYTDANGQCSLYLIPHSIYKLEVSKENYITVYPDYIPDPNIRTHTLRIYYDPGTGQDLRYIFYNLTWTLEPKNRYQQDSFTVYFNITSSDAQLEWYRMRVDFYEPLSSEWSIIYSGNASNPGGGSLSYTIPNETGRYRVLTYFKKVSYSEYEIGYSNGGCDIFHIIFGGGLSDVTEFFEGVTGWIFLLIVSVIAAFVMAFALPMAGVATGYIGIGIYAFAFALKPDATVAGASVWAILVIVILVYTLGLFVWSRL